MSNNNRQTWLIAYDIRQPARLQRVHKYLSCLGHALQYSLFVADLNHVELEAAKHELAKRADEAFDDVRMYALSEHVRGAWIGPLPGNQDISIHGSVAAGLAKNLAENPLD